ncbi:hypothetical protein EVAR_88698_1 [Eumeta japonica]|uniref:Uncharacterized protein n=1 Tax=Eumeta variegata TaxID=151549 RepID=A0A4C1Y024_EUMVA|nr:hypothetical protein EVAR_88698_1 [Eumeta japonica]
MGGLSGVASPAARARFSGGGPSETERARLAPSIIGRTPLFSDGAAGDMRDIMSTCVFPERRQYAPATIALLKVGPRSGAGGFGARPKRSAGGTQNRRKSPLL